MSKKLLEKKKKKFSDMTLFITSEKFLMCEFSNFKKISRKKNFSDVALFTTSKFFFIAPNFQTSKKFMEKTLKKNFF
jgi:hypothetical protein